MNSTKVLYRSRRSGNIPAPIRDVDIVKRLEGDQPLFFLPLFRMVELSHGLPTGLAALRNNFIVVKIKMKMPETMDLPVDPADIKDFNDTSAGLDRAEWNRNVARISLKQWRLFHAIVDYDGFVGAANKLHISQSSISHAMAKLQDQLGVTLLTLKGRKAHITEEGKVLLKRSRDLVRHAVDLEEVAESLRLGWEPEVRMVIAPDFPSDLLGLAFQELASLPRKVRLNVEEASVTVIKQGLHDNKVDLAVATEMMFGLVSKKLTEIEYVAVAHPDNPAFGLGRDISYDALQAQFQIVLSNVGEDGCSHLAQGSSRLKMNSLDSVVEALRYSLGYAWLPRYRIQPWLDAGQVRILPLSGGPNYIKPLYLILGRSVAADSITGRFAEALLSAAHAHPARRNNVVSSRLLSQVQQSYLKRSKALGRASVLKVVEGNAHPNGGAE